MESNSIQVIDNFLPKDYFLYLKEKIFSEPFPWLCSSPLCKSDNPYSICDDLDNIFFCHVLYVDRKPKSEYYDLFEDFFNHLSMRAIIKSKINCYTRTEKIVEHGYHQDNKFYESKSALLSLNDSDGYTKFKDSGRIIESKENRLLVFRSNLYHTSSTCTNTRRRVNINVTYF